MFANFIYFILALLIVATYQPSETATLTAIEIVMTTAVLFFLFSSAVRYQFRRICLMADRGELYRADHRFSTATSRLSIAALVVFAVIVHGLEAPSAVAGYRLFAVSPTLSALPFMGLFIGLLSLIWFHSWKAHRKLYDSRVSRKALVGANLRFSLPVLLPWLVISGVSDFLLALPLEWPRKVLSSAEGEAAYFLVFLLLVAVFAPVVIQWFWGCKPLEEGAFRRRIEALCTRAGVRYRDILYWPIFGGRMITAGVMGLIRRFRYILVTDALMKRLTPEEFDAVIAHEIGHVKKRHLLFYMLFVIGFMIIVSLLQILFYDWIPLIVISYLPSLAALMEWLYLKANPHLFISAVVILLFFLYFRFMFGFFIRHFERQADGFAFQFFNTAAPMVSTFQKIAKTSGQSPDKPNWHHFSILERIQFLQNCEQDRDLVARHSGMVNRWLVVFFLGLAGVVAFGYQLNFGPAKYAMSEFLYEKALIREMGDDFSRAHLYQYLGDRRYGEGDMMAAAAAYERSLASEPGNAQVMNNLAWLLATAEEQSLQDPKRALDLALESVRLSPSAHALDTLAESYFANNDVEAAVATAALAVERAGENRAYYEEQLERFRNMLGKGKRSI